MENHGKFVKIHENIWKSWTWHLTKSRLQLISIEEWRPRLKNNSKESHWPIEAKSCQALILLRVTVWVFLSDKHCSSLPPILEHGESISFVLIVAQEIPSRIWNYNISKLYLRLLTWTITHEMTHRTFQPCKTSSPLTCRFQFSFVNLYQKTWDNYVRRSLIWSLPSCVSVEHFHQTKTKHNAQVTS